MLLLFFVCSQDSELGCSATCGCSESYHPVCGEDGRIYSSPCHAGCTGLNTTDSKQVCGL